MAVTLVVVVVVVIVVVVVVANSPCNSIHAYSD